MGFCDRWPKLCPWRPRNPGQPGGDDGSTPAEFKAEFQTYLAKEEDIDFSALARIAAYNIKRDDEKAHATIIYSRLPEIAIREDIPKIELAEAMLEYARTLQEWSLNSEAQDTETVLNERELNARIISTLALLLASE